MANKIKVTALAISKNDLEALFLSDKKWEKFGRKFYMLVDKLSNMLKHNGKV